MDVKILNTTGDKWEVINVTVLEKTLLSLEKWQIWSERQKHRLKSNKC